MFSNSSRLLPLHSQLDKQVALSGQLSRLNGSVDYQGEIMSVGLSRRSATKLSRVEDYIFFGFHNEIPSYTYIDIGTGRSTYVVGSMLPNYIVPDSVQVRRICSKCCLE